MASGNTPHPHDPHRGARNFFRAVNICGKLLPGALRWKMGMKNPQKLRECISAAGPVCVKAAQWAIDRAELFSDELVEALRPLQDQHEVHEWAHTRRMLQEQMPSNMFAWVEATPFACGSIGQVHRAQLLDGTDCAVKVLHPNVRRSLEEDLEALMLVLKLFPACKNFDLDEVRSLIAAQTNMRSEADHLQTFRRNFQGRVYVHIPEPFACSEDVLVMSFVPGVPFDIFLEEHPTMAKEAIVARIAAYIKMGWVDNFLHGDMHRGNILYSVAFDGRVALSLVDAGMVTVVKNAEALKRFVDGMFTLQPNDLATLMVELNTNPHADIHGFSAQVNSIQSDLEYEASALVRYRDIIHRMPLAADFVRQWESKIAADEANGGSAKVIRPCSTNMVKLIRTIISAIQKHHLMVPGDIILVALTLTVVDGQSDLYLEHWENVFHDALIYAKETHLINIDEWLGLDPTPLLLLDRAMRFKEHAVDPEAGASANDDGDGERHEMLAPQDSDSEEDDEDEVDEEEDNQAPNVKTDDQ
jgi:hypothetical protein